MIEKVVAPEAVALLLIVAEVELETLLIVVAAGTTPASVIAAPTSQPVNAGSVLVMAAEPLVLVPGTERATLFVNGVK